MINEFGKDLTRHLTEPQQLDVAAIRQHPELRYQLLDLPDLLGAMDQLLDTTRDASDVWREDTPPPPPPPIQGF